MDDDFEWRREQRRQKREEMRLEAERMAYRRNEEDEEEAARERRRRARQERIRGKDAEEVANPAESAGLNSHSVTVAETVSSSELSSGQANEGDDEEQALLERLAKREERRQRRMKEAMDRQKQQDSIDAPSYSTYSVESSSTTSYRAFSNQEEEEAALNSKEEEVKEEVKKEVIPQMEVVEEKSPRSYLREQESTEKKAKIEDEAGIGQDSVCPRKKCSPLNEDLAHSTWNSKQEVEEDVAEVHEDVAEGDENELEMEDEEPGLKSKQQNGGLYEDGKHKKVERTQSRGSAHSSEGPAAEEGDDGEQTRLEAERKLEELKRRRDETENEEFERMKQKQQEAEAELEELKRKREERRKVLEEEERLKKQEEAEKKAREEEEKRRMKEEIERRRAEAAERRQKVGEEVDGEASKPFKCVSPRGSSLKIGERAEFLNRSAQKSAAKASHSPVVSKIDNRLEQYTTAVQSNKEVRSPRVAAVDLPVVSDGVRNIKSMWEKGNVFSSTISSPSSNKDAAGIKVGVAGRINDWLNKTPEASKTPGGRPVDLKPGDVTGKRNLWENKSSPATKMTGRGESKSVANGTGH
ncbi:caldesmon 1a isoform X1 [Clarias gariepinus]|uniref:caldesmon 1a isoform X1 n=1 Tax=Clarias gariepinus TaxID=13013 RepID=UPI00234D1B6D|nr:caldesmon 1a isoform X1 [Clarias gariepinus]XP_053364537.1 caldesmon 1a isoform X1 [Clarias gariepinus]